MFVLGRDDDPPGAPTAHLGHARARDGSLAGPVGLDLDRPHAALVVGKRGSGKSHTLGVLAEALGRTRGVTGVVLDPMGSFVGLAAEESLGRVIAPRVRADALPPRRWPGVFGLSPTGPVGALVWQAAAEAPTLAGMRAFVDDADADADTRRAAANLLSLAASWDVFSPDGLVAADFDVPRVSVLDVAPHSPAARSVVCAAVLTALYDSCVAGEFDRLPWVLLDEAHALVDGVAAAPLRTAFTRGRAPGLSVVAATQRPGSLPAVAVSQADLLVVHRLTAAADRAAFAEARPVYLTETLRERIPDGVGEALVVDDASEVAQVVRVRPRETPRGGETPRVSDRTGAESGTPASDATPERRESDPTSGLPLSLRP